MEAGRVLVEEAPTIEVRPITVGTPIVIFRSASGIENAFCHNPREMGANATPRCNYHLSRPIPHFLIHLIRRNARGRNFASVIFRDDAVQCRRESPEERVYDRHPYPTLGAGHGHQLSFAFLPFVLRQTFRFRSKTPLLGGRPSVTPSGGTVCATMT